MAPRPGEIHLLRPVAAPWGPVYVLLLEPAGSGFLAIPFGRYATPAVPGEWCSGIDVPPLQVLCGWNSRVVGAAHLLPGSAKRVCTKQLVDARAMHRIVHGDGAAAAHETARFGPPLLHPADPRYEYLDEERERLDAHLPVAREQEEDGRATRWLLAAKGRPRYGCDDDA